MIAVALALVAALHGRMSRADVGPKIGDSLWLPVGMNLGASLNPDPAPNGLLLGPEVSLVHVTRDLTWFGAYTDVLRDFGADVTRLSVGLESGVTVFGLDVGYVAAFGDGKPRSGVRGRLLLSFAAVHLYGGVGRMFGEPKAHTYGEIGVLVKVPLLLREGTDRPRHRDRRELAPDAAPPEPPAAAPGPEAQPLVPAPDPSPFAEPPPGS